MNDSPEELVPDLDWLAFCYATGELDAEQTAAFEALLATNQDARERLAAMVALSQHVADVPRVALATATPAQSGKRTSERFAWLALGVAMLLAAIWLGRNLSNREGSGQRFGNGDAELANAWAESLADDEDDDEDSAIEDIDTDTSASSVADATAEPAVDDSLEVPDWMFIALGGEDSSTDAGDGETDMEESSSGADDGDSTHQG